MTRLEFSTEIDAPIVAVWDFYADIQNLPRITPPATRVRLPDPQPRLEAGVRFTLVLFQPPLYLPMRWETVFAVVRPPTLFIDTQGSVGPFAYWRHEHLFEDLGNDRTLLRDSVTFRAPFGPAGWIADRLLIRPLLMAMFAYRHKKTREALDRK
jgi:ligand-binding SRPBCC domain-containing protein